MENLNVTTDNWQQPTGYWSDCKIKLGYNYTFPTSVRGWLKIEIKLLTRRYRPRQVLKTPNADNFEYRYKVNIYFPKYTYICVLIRDSSPWNIIKAGDLLLITENWRQLR